MAVFRQNETMYEFLIIVKYSHDYMDVDVINHA